MIQFRLDRAMKPIANFFTNVMTNLQSVNVIASCTKAANKGKEAASEASNSSSATSADTADSVPSGMGTCRISAQWLINGFVLLSFIGLLTVVETNLVNFPKMGFYCDDPKIAHKYNGDTVTVTNLFAGCILGPIILMACVEYCLTKSKGGLRQALKWYGNFSFGLLLLVFLVETAKTIISEPRPHFLDTCRPDKAVNCTSGYVSEYICTNNDAKSYLVKDSFKSFPSGHSAMGFYVSIFLSSYLHFRLPDSKFLLVPWLQCLCLLWGVLCGLTRITDGRHHWWDVLFGSFFGCCIAAYAVTRLCNKFRCQEASSENSSESSVGSGKIFSSRRLLSSTSSYTPPDEKDVRVLS